MARPRRLQMPVMDDPPMPDSIFVPLPKLVEGLVEQLPPAGAVWPEAQRAKWLELAGQVFNVVYRPAEDDL